MTRVVLTVRVVVVSVTVAASVTCMVAVGFPSSPVAIALARTDAAVRFAARRLGLSCLGHRTVALVFGATGVEGVPLLFLCGLQFSSDVVISAEAAVASIS